MQQLLRVLLGVVLLGGALLACAAQDADTSSQLQEADFQNEFARFIRTFNRTYATTSASARGGSSEFNTRYSVFKTNLQLIRTHNAAAARGEHSYTLAVNEFADMSDEEYRQQREASRARFREALRNLPRTNETVIAGADAPASRSLLQTPTAVDWVTAGRVPVPVWNTYTCGGDYAVQSSDAVASLFAVTGGYKPVPLSAQQILDCSDQFGNQGCFGGMPDMSFQYLTNVGMQSDLEYPWIASQWTCRYGNGQLSGAPDVVPHLLGFQYAPNESALLARLALQPVIVALSTSTIQQFRFYYEGVFSDPDCGDELDMNMLVVGYGHDAASGKDFWRLKNHWTTQWGDGGYMRVERGIGMCGFGLYSIYPTSSSLL